MPSNDESASAEVMSAWAFSPGRVWVLAQNTFTQLVRMKTFYFLLVFAVLILLVASVQLWEPLKHLAQIKRWSFGAMHVFSVVYAIAATSLLLPKDLEDRTLYTILSKPVPRFEYLIGRLLGVVMVIGLALLAMFVLMCVLVQLMMPDIIMVFKQGLLRQAGGEAVSAQEMNIAIENAKQQGVTMSLFWALWSQFLQAAVIAAIALFISTFATSSLFTIVMTSIIVLIGHFHQLAIGYYLNEAGVGALGEMLIRIFTMVFPNLGMFDVTDEIISGTKFFFGEAVKLTLLGLFYTALYLLLSLLIFIDKEL